MPQPPENSERPDANPWRVYHEALGRFLLAYAETEVLLHIVLHRRASVDPTVLSALMGALRTGDLIKHIKIISEVTGAVKSAIDENSRNSTQLSLISKMRDLLLHRKTEHYNGRFYVHNRWTAKKHSEAEFHEISIEIINAMLIDLQTIRENLTKVNQSEAAEFLWPS